VNVDGSVILCETCDVYVGLELTILHTPSTNDGLLKSPSEETQFWYDETALEKSS
jgi:hypothetical protein